MSEEKSPAVTGHKKWREIIARYVAWQAVRCLHRILFADTPMPKAFALLPVVKTEVPFSNLDRQKQIDNKKALIVLFPY